MIKTSVAVPSCAPGGIDAQISEHFGHCDLFTLVEIDNAEVTSVDFFPASPTSMAAAWFQSICWPNAGSRS